MSLRRRRRRKALGLIWLGSFIFATIAQYGPKSTSLANFFERIQAENVIITGLICALVLFSIDALHRKILPKFRRSPMLVSAFASSLLYLLAIVAIVYGLLWITVLLQSLSFSRATQRLVEIATTPNNWKGIAYIFGMAVVITFMIEFSRRIGPGRILNWLLGKYRNPKEEQRVFLLIDLKDSTPLAEKLGALKFSYLLRDFFSDMSEAVLDTGGELIAFVGDEAILSWSLEDAVRDGNCLRCYQLFKHRIAAESGRYLRDFGFVPGFKGALHLGPIVATEVGDFRTEVVFHGDALNTVSRVLGECNPLGAELLITDDIARHLAPIAGVELEELGAVELRGKADPVKLFRATVSEK